MKVENLWMLGGFLCAFLILFVIAQMQRKKRYGAAKQYDERQEAIRGRGFKYAYFFVMFADLIYAMGFSNLEKHVVDPTLVLLAILLFSGLVLFGYTYWNDAYWGVRDLNHKGLYILWCAMVVLFCFQGVRKITDGEIMVNGAVTFDGGLPFVMAGFFGGWLLIMGATALKNKREADE